MAVMMLAAIQMKSQTVMNLTDKQQALVAIAANEAKAPLPSTHPRFCAYSCAIEVRLMCVCCPFVNRTTIEQQSDNNRTTMGGRAKERLG